MCVLPAGGGLGWSGEAISRMIDRPGLYLGSTAPGDLGYLAPIHAAKKRRQNHVIIRPTYLWDGHTV